MLQICGLISLLLLFVSQANRPDILCCVKLSEGQQGKSEGCLFRFFKKIYAPFILKDWVRPLVVSVMKQDKIEIVLIYFYYYYFTYE